MRLLVLAMVWASLGCDGHGPSVADATGDMGIDGVGIDSGQCGDACVPVALDRCKQKNEIPLAGGGCKAVGLEECASGVKTPGESSCTAAGIPDPCPVGWVQTQDTSCADGEKNCGSYCFPALPASACVAGQTEALGQTSCQQVGDCGSGTWGSIVARTDTVYVNAAYSAGGSDGSQQKPFTTVAAAVAAASPGGHVAIAAGSYAESPTLDKPLVIEGRCPDQVTLAGLTVATGGATLRGVTVSGPAVGVAVNDNSSASLEHVVLSGCQGGGLAAGSKAAVTVEDTLIADNLAVGLKGTGAALTLRRSVVRDTEASGADLATGHGLWLEGGFLKLEDSLVSGNRAVGIRLLSAGATVTRTVIRETRPRADDLDLGMGLLAEVSGLGFNFSPPKIVLTDVVVTANRTTGVALGGVDATLSRVTVRETKPSAADQHWGHGVELLNANLAMSDSLVARNRFFGVILVESTAKLARTVVRDTLTEVHGNLWGNGLAAQPLLDADGQAVGKGSQLQLAGCVVARNRQTSLLVWAPSSASLTRSVVRDTLPALDGRFGHSVMVSPFPGVLPGTKALPGTLKLTDSLVSGGVSSSLSLFSSIVTIERTVVADADPSSITTEYGSALHAEMHDVANDLVAAGMPRAQLTLRESVFSGTRGTGLYLGPGTSTTMERCAVRDTAAEPARGWYGDGVVVDALFNKKLAPSAHTRAELQMTGSVVERCGRAGLIFFGGGGKVERSGFLDNVVPIAKEQGADATIAGDNLYSGNTEDRVQTSQGFKPTSPPPPVPSGT